mmetsp:Transcript_25407/g.78227  ORF Transcript_25407/g.78227 Transcript_25407/m.78227 type:complete len:353 (-) Transcript_25407:238-1296(-)
MSSGATGHFFPVQSKGDVGEEVERLGRVVAWKRYRVGAWKRDRGDGTRRRRRRVCSRLLRRCSSHVVVVVTSLFPAARRRSFFFFAGSRIKEKRGGSAAEATLKINDGLVEDGVVGAEVVDFVADEVVVVVGDVRFEAGPVVFRGVAAVPERGEALGGAVVVVLVLLVVARDLGDPEHDVAHGGPHGVGPEPVVGLDGGVELLFEVGRRRHRRDQRRLLVLLFRRGNFLRRFPEVHGSRGVAEVERIFVLQRVAREPRLLQDRPCDVFESRHRIGRVLHRKRGRQRFRRRQDVLVVREVVPRLADLRRRAAQIFKNAQLVLIEGPLRLPRGQERPPRHELVRRLPQTTRVLV